MDKDGKKSEHNFSGIEFQILPTDYHTWGCPVFVLETPLRGVPSGIPKLEPKARTGVYLGHSPFHAGKVDILLNTITGHISPQ